MTVPTVIGEERGFFASSAQEVRRRESGLLLAEMDEESQLGLC